MVLLVSDIFESSFISLHPYDQPWCKSVNGVEFVHNLPFTPEIIEENNNEHWTGHVYNDQSRWYTGIPMAHVASDSLLGTHKVWFLSSISWSQIMHHWEFDCGTFGFWIFVALLGFPWPALLQPRFKYRPCASTRPRNLARCLLSMRMHSLFHMHMHP